MTVVRHPSSFRDPNSGVFIGSNFVERKFSIEGRNDFIHCEKSGLFSDLIGRELLLDYTIQNEKPTDFSIRTEKLHFISYASEWCFSQLRAAALLTLEIEQTALNYGCSLKDASSYNVQFIGAYPVFIDHGSFVPLCENEPWMGYNQFCQHFLAPLLLLSRNHLAPNNIAGTEVTGIKIDLAAKLLPVWQRGAIGHIHLQNYFLQKYSTPVSSSGDKDYNSMSLSRRKTLIQSLYECVKKLSFKVKKTEWGSYYDEESNNYLRQSTQSKENIVSELCGLTRAKKALDIGANLGKYSRIAAKTCDLVISADYDVMAINNNYRKSIKLQERNLQVIYLDVMHPTPAIGWLNEERQSFLQRADFDLVIALALIHHLVITEGVPLEKVCDLFCKLTKKYLIIEIPNVNDSQIEILQKWGGENSHLYSLADFESTFEKYFIIKEIRRVKESERNIYLLEKI